MYKQTPDCIVGGLYCSFYYFRAAMIVSATEFGTPEGKLLVECTYNFLRGRSRLFTILKTNYLRAAMIVSATEFGTISYRRNSIVNPARPSVIERRFVM